MMNLRPFLHETINHVLVALVTVCASLYVSAEETGTSESGVCTA